MACRVWLVLGMVAALVALAGAQTGCIQSGLTLLQSCGPERDYIGRTFMLNSQVPLTDAQLNTIMQDRPAGVPSDKCCKGATSFALPPNQCQCDNMLKAVLPAGDVTPTGLDGMLKIVGAACNATIPAC